MGTHAYIISRGYALDCTGVVYNSIYNIHKRNVECTWVGLPDEKHGMYFVRIPRFPRNDGMTCLNLHRNKIQAISHAAADQYCQVAMRFGGPPQGPK